MCFLISPRALYFVCGLSVCLTKLFFKVHCSLPSKWSQETMLSCLCRLFLDSASNSTPQDLVPALLYFQLYSLFLTVMVSPFPSSEQMPSVWEVQTVGSSLPHLLCSSVSKSSHTHNFLHAGYLCKTRKTVLFFMNFLRQTLNFWTLLLQPS